MRGIVFNAPRDVSVAAIVLAGHHEDRLEMGRRLGATHAVDSTNAADLAALLGDLTEGRGPEATVDSISSG